MTEDRSDEFPITWGLFVKLEMAEQLPSEDVDAFYDAAVAENRGQRPRCGYRESLAVQIT